MGYFCEPDEPPPTAADLLEEIEAYKFQIYLADEAYCQVLETARKRYGAVVKNPALFTEREARMISNQLDFLQSSRLQIPKNPTLLHDLTGSD